MATSPQLVSLELTPSARFDVIDVAERVRERRPDFFEEFPRSLCCSLHTTAGYLEQGLCARLGHSQGRVGRLVGLFRRLFPHDAGYHHDRLELRKELSAAEREQEPVNADSHLTFMSAGLSNCVTYRSEPDAPIYFIDLDGINEHFRRVRRTAVLGYAAEEEVFRATVEVPASGHAIDSFNLKDPALGLFERIEQVLSERGVEIGRIDIGLAPGERHAGLTVNEAETLLMRDDLPEALRDPLRWALRHGGRLLRHPTSIPGKTREYAVYDLVHLYNEVMDVLGVGRAVADRILSRLAGPAWRLFRLKRHVSFPVTDGAGPGGERIIQGRYQSPILIQHRAAESGARRLEVTVWRFE
ncbi:MAG TPA: hypothetical protein VKB18_03935 [Gemmatimonadota bacterium]|nr:hypothetical protein [Gemmatimonadota bacterium]